MELNAEQVKKALDWLDSLVGNSNDSDIAMFTYQLLGILYDTCEELTEENERLRAIPERICEEARQMCFIVGDEEYVTLCELDQIAKEMLEDNKVEFEM